MAEALHIDRERFLLMVVAIAAQSCGPPPSPSPPSITVAPPVEPPEPEPAAAPSSCETENDTGDVDCTKFHARKLVGPACEGTAGTCDILKEGNIYRPRAARAAAACLERLGKRACDIAARRRCYEEGIKAACPEPRFEQPCAAKIQECKAAGIRVRYTEEQCVQVMSSLKGGDRKWALEAMGPSAEGSCNLMFTVF